MTRSDQKRSPIFASSPGQSLVEVALLFPALLILLSGLIEFGFFLNEYLTVQDGVRNAARFSSDSDYQVTDNIPAICSAPETGFPRPECCLGPAGNNGTVDFYMQTACLVNVELNNMAPDVQTMCLSPGPGNTCNYGVLDPNLGSETSKNEILISVFSVDQASHTPVTRIGGQDGWSYAEHYQGYTGGRNQVTRMTETDIANRLATGAPNTGYLLVEVFYQYEQKLKLPWITAFVADPIPLHAFTIMPLSSAEPTPMP